jgi:O-antigen/teichoic acid export membrane protein
MSGLRRAFLTASAGRYVIMAINLASMLVMARLLTPGEYGVVTLASGIFAIAEATRAIGGGAYLIQRLALVAEDARTTFTVSLGVTLFLALLLGMIAEPLARATKTPELDAYIRVSLLSFVAGPIASIVAALLSREMAFGKIAIISVSIASVDALARVSLSLAGLGSMSFPWAGAISAGCGMVFSLFCWKDRSIFIPSLHQWRSVIRFGAFESTSVIIAQIGQFLPFLIFARFLDAQAVGLCQRTFMLCLVPERLILAGVAAVALPAFSKEVRAGADLKATYLRAIEFLTAAQWPPLILLIFLAGPIIRMLLGLQWEQAAPLTQTFAAALLFSIPLGLTYPVLVARGAIRLLPPIFAAQAIVSAVCLTLAAAHGLRAAALSTFFIVPFDSMLSVLVVKRLIGVRWIDLGLALRKSVAVAALCAIGPAVAMLATRNRPDMPLVVTMLSVASCAIGWLYGVWLTGHPLLHEIYRLTDMAWASPYARRAQRACHRTSG